MTEVSLPFIARGLSRRILDEALLQKAQSRGARIIRGVLGEVDLGDRSRISLDTGVHAHDPGGDASSWQRASMTCEGRSGRPVGTMDDLIGFKAHYRLAKAQQEALEGCCRGRCFSLAAMPGCS